MPPLTRHPRISDDAYVARVARVKIYREFRRADPDLRLCVGHANMLDRINDSAKQVAVQKRSRTPQSQERIWDSAPQSQPNSRIREISSEYISLKPEVEHVEEVEIEVDNNLCLTTHFNLPESDSDEDSPPSSPEPVTVSIVSVEVDDDEYDEFGLPRTPVKHSINQEYHAPPLLTSTAAKNECPLTGMLATLSVSEVLSTDDWD